jgi:hypothetical protein
MIRWVAGPFNLFKVWREFPRQFEEIVGGYVRGTGSGDEDAFGSEAQKGAFDQFAIGADGRRTLRFPFCKRRRIEDDHVKLLIRFCR